MPKQDAFGDLTDDERTRLGMRIRVLVEAAGTQSDAARIADVSVQQLGRFMNARNAPSLLPLARLAGATGISLDWVVTGEGPQRRDRPLEETAEGFVSAFTDRRRRKGRPAREADEVLATPEAVRMAERAGQGMASARRQMLFYASFLESARDLYASSGVPVTSEDEEDELVDPVIDFAQSVGLDDRLWPELGELVLRAHRTALERAGRRFGPGNRPSRRRGRDA